MRSSSGVTPRPSSAPIAASRSIGTVSGPSSGFVLEKTMLRLLRNAQMDRKHEIHRIIGLQAWVFKNTTIARMVHTEEQQCFGLN
jgi:hypothetical protein